MGGVEHDGQDRPWPESIGLVGAGAMGTAMLAGLLAVRPALARACVVSDADSDAADLCARSTGARVGEVAAAAGCDLVVLAVKPKDVEAALGVVGEAVTDGSVVLSVAAGWPLDRLRDVAPRAQIVRTMPNLAVRHACGVIGVATTDLDPEREAALVGLLGEVGAVLVVPESSFPAITALAGSGPGLVALVAEALEEGAVGVGLDRAGARRLTQAVLAGTAALLSDGGDPAQLRQRVSSPGGTTIAGLAVLERGGVRAHIADAVRAAAVRAAEL